MTEADLKALQPGDLIRHKGETHVLLVAASYGAHCIAIRMQHVSNPQEWDLISKAGRG